MRPFANTTTPFGKGGDEDARCHFDDNDYASDYTCSAKRDRRGTTTLVKLRRMLHPSVNSVLESDVTLGSF